MKFRCRSGIFFLEMFFEIGILTVLKTNMKTLTSLIMASVLGIGAGQANIVVHGSTTDLSGDWCDWLTMASNDIDGSSGLGSDGYIFFGDFDGTQENGQPYSLNVASLPSYPVSHGPKGVTKHRCDMESVR